MLRYLRDDVTATTKLYRACRQELSAHPGIALEETRLYSPATVAVSYFEAMGLRPSVGEVHGFRVCELGWSSFGEIAPFPRPMPKEPLRRELFGYSMAGFFGGRAEAADCPDAAAGHARRLHLYVPGGLMPCSEPGRC